MSPRQLIPLLTIAIYLSSCTQYALYQSPFHNTTNSYKTMPVKSDTPAAAFYASGVFFAGGAGDDVRDGHSGFTGSVYRAHSAGPIRGYYGLTTSLGNYRVHGISGYSTYEPTRKYPNDSLINARSGSKFFGGVGAVGGLYVTHSFPSGSEWRIIGVEANWQYEFGNYWKFRDRLPDTAANLVSRSQSFLAIAFNTEIVVKTRRGNAGIKLGGGIAGRTETEYSASGKPTTLLPGFFSTTFQVTRNNGTWFTQFNLGTYSFNFMTGLNFRL